MANISTSPPAASVQKAFGCSGKLIHLRGGEGTSYKCGDIVLKPATDELQVEWFGRISPSIKQVGFRLARPVISSKGSWSYQGWQAFTYEPGGGAEDRWQEKLVICSLFHKAISHLPKPDFIASATHPWAVADRMIWGEEDLVYSTRLKPVIDRLLLLLKPVNLTPQVIHGDMTGNILFHLTLPPAIIDFSPYFRPADYASAIVIVDSVVWGKAPLELLDQNIERIGMYQLLVRATLWRIKTTEEYIHQFGTGDINQVDQYHELVEHLELKYT